MPVLTRAERATNDSTDQVAEGPAAAPAVADDGGAGQEPSLVVEAGGSPSGRRTRTPGSLARVVARASANARSTTTSTTESTTGALSPEQLAIITDLIKSAVKDGAASLSDASVDKSTPAGAPAVESGTTVDDSGDAAKSRKGNQLAPPAADDGLEFVHDIGKDNPHARAVHTGGDTYLRPQRYNMHRDTTFDVLKSKPKGTLFKEYCTLEPSLRYMFNVRHYLAKTAADAESGDMSPEEFVLHLDRVYNSVSGVYDLLNRHVGLIHLRAQYGDNPTAREKAKLEHIEDVLTEEDYLPASLDDRIRDIAREFDDSFDSAKKNALAKKAANGGGGTKGGDDDAPKESRRAKAKRLESERKAAADAKKKAEAERAK